MSDDNQKPGAVDPPPPAPKLPGLEEENALKKARRCPFCAERNGLKMMRAPDPKFPDRFIYRIACFVCFAGGPMAGTQSSAMAKWNRRNA